MSIERARPCSGPSPVTMRLCATIVFFIGVICVLGGYLLCHMSRNDVKKSNDIVSFNLTIAAENLYKKAKKTLPKAILHSEPEKVTAKLLHIFNCTQTECGNITNYNVADFIKRAVNLKVMRLLKTVNYAYMYLDSLR